MDIDIQKMKERLTGVIANRIAWSIGDEFNWDGGYGGTAYAEEGECNEVNHEKGQIRAEIPLSINDPDESDAVAYINVTVEVTDVEEIG